MNNQPVTRSSQSSELSGRNSHRVRAFDPAMPHNNPLQIIAMSSNTNNNLCLGNTHFNHILQFTDDFVNVLPLGHLPGILIPKPISPL